MDRWLLGAVAALLSAESTRAQEVRGAEAYAELVRCRALPADAERLACFDRGAAALAEAVGRNEVAVVDRERVRAAKRSLFGIALPDIRLFDRDDDQPIQQIETTIRTVALIGQSRYRLGLAEGGTWRTVEPAERLYPEPGQSIVVRRAALGSYLAKVGARSVRVERVD